MKNKFKPLKTRFRATFHEAMFAAGSADDRVDTEKEILHNVQITLEGEALGHGIWLDRQFCEDVAKQGNAAGDVGVKVRYGHPAMCSDAIGTELGRAKDFHVEDIERTIDGEKVKCAGVFADVHLLKSAHAAPQGDIAKHVMETAKEDPSQFGQSIVFTYADWVVKDKDGNRHSYNEEVVKPLEDDLAAQSNAFVFYAKEKELTDAWMEKSADGKVYAVLGKLHGTDFTDTPAATDGIFSTGTLAEEAETMLAEHPQILEVLEKNPKSLAEFLERTGLADKLESARVAGLQAAKDKELHEMSSRYKADLTAQKERHEAALAEAKSAALAEAQAALAAQMDELRASNESLKADIDAKQKALDDAKASVEQLTAKCAEAEKALADTQAALAAETKRYREQIGLALKPEESRFAGLSGRDLAVAGLKSRANG